MKALTLTQPWASLVAVGAKRIETRSWETNYRGTIAIHAAKGWKPIDREFAVSARVCEALGVAPDVVMAYLTARRGHVLAVGFAHTGAHRGKRRRGQRRYRFPSVASYLCDRH